MQTQTLHTRIVNAVLRNLSVYLPCALLAVIISYDLKQDITSQLWSELDLLLITPMILSNTTLQIIATMFDQFGRLSFVNYVLHVLPTVVTILPMASMIKFYCFVEDPDVGLMSIPGAVHSLSTVYITIFNDFIVLQLQSPWKVQMQKLFPRLQPASSLPISGAIFCACMLLFLVIFESVLGYTLGPVQFSKEVIDSMRFQKDSGTAATKLCLSCIFYGIVYMSWKSMLIKYVLNPARCLLTRSFPKLLMKRMCTCISHQHHTLLRILLSIWDDKASPSIKFRHNQTNRVVSSSALLEFAESCHNPQAMALILHQLPGQWRAYSVQNEHICKRALQFILRDKWNEETFARRLVPAFNEDEKLVMDYIHDKQDLITLIKMVKLYLHNSSNQNLKYFVTKLMYADNVHAINLLLLAGIPDQSVRILTMKSCQQIGRLMLCDHFGTSFTPPVFSFKRKLLTPDEIKDLRYRTRPFLYASKTFKPVLLNLICMRHFCAEHRLKQQLLHCKVPQNTSAAYICLPNDVVDMLRLSLSQI